jgi:hypothetical protein
MEMSASSEVARYWNIYDIGKILLNTNFHFCVDENTPLVHLDPD